MDRREEKVYMCANALAKFNAKQTLRQFNQ